MFHFQCRGLVLCAKFVQRVVGGQFCVQNLFSGLSAGNFVCEICSADCRQAISCTKFVQRIVGKQFCVRNLFSGLSTSNFVCEICSADCRQVILCTKFVQRDCRQAISCAKFRHSLLPLPLLRPRVDVAGAERMRDYWNHVGATINPQSRFKSVIPTP